MFGAVAAARRRRTRRARHHTTRPGSTTARIAVFDRRTSVAERRAAFAPPSGRWRWQPRAACAAGCSCCCRAAPPRCSPRQWRASTLEDKIETARLLMRAGAAIDELNCVRKHLSRDQGRPAGCRGGGATITLALSDVHGPWPTIPRSSVPGRRWRMRRRSPMRSTIVDEVPRRLPPRCARSSCRAARAARLRRRSSLEIARYRTFELHGRSATARRRWTAPAARAEARLRRSCSSPKATAGEARGPARRSSPTALRAASRPSPAGLRDRVRRDDRHGPRQRLGRTESGVRARQRWRRWPCEPGRSVVLAAPAPTASTARPTAAGAIWRRDDDRASAAPLASTGSAALEQNDAYRFFAALGRPDRLGTDRHQRRRSARAC